VGAPKKSYLDQISSYLTGDKQLKLSASEITQQAKDKINWRRRAAAHLVIDR
jgi:hypothetical protein